MTVPGTTRITFVGVVACWIVVGSGQVVDAIDLTRPLPEPLPPPLAAEAGDEGKVPEKATRQASFEDEVMEMVNQARWDDSELPPLKRCGLLDSVAEGHSTRMGTNNFAAHCDLDSGQSPWDRMIAAGYVYSGGNAAENIAFGQSSPWEVMFGTWGWMNSAGHRANILATNTYELGIGYYYDAPDIGNVRRDANGDCVADTFNTGPWFHYWTQNFGRRSGVYPVVIDREAYDTDTLDVDLYLYGSGFASEMRIRNDGGSWTAWQPFTANVSWQLAPAAGVREVFVEIRNGVGTTFGASDTIVSAGSGDVVFIDRFESGNTTGWSSVFP